jgi:1-acyl-sn-glycerol-3-phosphate acyltransferase
MSLQKTWYRIIWHGFGALVRVLCRLEVEGASNVPPQGPFIFATNHLNIFDPTMVLASLPYCEITVLAAEKWEKRWPISWLLISMGTIFVRRGEVDRKALSQCMAVLQAGGILGLAPEGTRSRTGMMQRGKPGIAYMAIKADVPIVPIGVSGQEKIIANWIRLRRPHIQVCIGQPFKLEPVQGRQKGEQLQDQADEVMRRIAVLVREDLRGVYADSARELESAA